MTPPVDPDGIRTTPRAGAAGVSARLLGMVLVASAVAVLAISATAVWWLRRDAGTSTDVADAGRDDEAPPQVMIADANAPSPERAVQGGVRAVRLQPAAAPTAEPTGKPAKPARRPPPGAAAAAGGAAEARDAVPSGAAAPADDAADAEAAHVEQRDDRAIEETAEGVINAMRAAGETKGLAAIPPRDTNPVKSGLIVPKDFVLPEGYIRYYQTTDDGRRLEPILMYSPDYAFVDDQGKPIPLPRDGIVTPDMAPPGLPKRMLDVPGSPRARGAQH